MILIYPHKCTYIYAVIERCGEGDNKWLEFSPCSAGNDPGISNIGPHSPANINQEELHWGIKLVCEWALNQIWSFPLSKGVDPGNLLMSSWLKEGNRRLWWKPGSTSRFYRQKVGKLEASYWNQWQSLPLTSIGKESGPRNVWKPENCMAQEKSNRSWWVAPINHQCKPGHAWFRLKIAFVWCLFETFSLWNLKEELAAEGVVWTRGRRLDRVWYLLCPCVIAESPS